MAVGAEYRIKAAELQAQGTREPNGRLQAAFFQPVHAYLRLADQAECNSLADIVYEPPFDPKHAGA